MALRFDGKVVVVTGAGNGLGRSYALYFGARGAKVVVNDLGGSASGVGSSSKAADVVVEEIKKAGGEAVANYDSVQQGDKIVGTALKAFGRVDVLINNAGILRDSSMVKMKEEDWDLIMKVHLKGTFSCTKAAWNKFREQGFGRIINTSSSSGTYGNFGQANYSAAKLGIHGFTLTCAKEGESKNVLSNTICPVSVSRMTESLFNKDMASYFKPEFVVPLVGYLAHESCQENGGLFEVGGGYVSRLRWQRSEGAYFGDAMTAENVRDRIKEISDFGRKNAYPLKGDDTIMRVLQLRGKL